MTKKEIVHRNIGLTFDFLRQAIKEPEMLNNIPDGSILEFVDKDFPQIETIKKEDSKTNVKYLRVTSRFELL